MKRFLFILLALAICAQPAAAQNRPLNPARNPEFLKAQELESKGELAGAITIYRRLNEAEPNNLYFWKLISLYEQMEDWESIETFARESLERQPGFLDARRYLSRALSARGKPEEARNVLMEVLKGEPDPDAVEFIASELLVQRDYPGALDMFLKGRSSLGDSLAFTAEIAQVYQFQEDFFGALREYAKIIDEDPSAFMRLSQLIARAGEQGATPEAIAVNFTAYLEKHPESISAARLAAAVYQKSGKFAEAFRVLRNPAVATDNYADIWNLAEQVRGEGMDDLAVTIYDDYYAAFPEIPSRHRAMMASAELLKGMGKTAETKARYQAVIADYAGKAPAAAASVRLMEISREELAFSAYIRMLTEFAETTEFAESSFEAWLALGDAYLRENQAADADSAYANAVLKARTNDERYRAGVRFAWQAFYTGAADRLSDLITQAVSIAPGGSDINDLLELKVLFLRCANEQDRILFDEFAKGRYALYRGAADDAIAIFTGLAADTSSVMAPEAAMELGGLYRSREQNREASSWYLKAAAVSPDTTVRVGAVIAAAELVEPTPEGRAEAKKLYLDTLAGYPGTVYDGEIRKRLQALMK